MNEAAAAPGADASAGVSAVPPSLMATLRELWQDLPGLLNDRVELLSLELHRAGTALVQIVVLVVAMAILGVTAWLVLWGATVMALVAAGLHLGWALAAAALVNLGTALWAAARVRHLLPLLRLPATRRHLMISPSPPPRAASDQTPDEHLGRPVAP